MHSMVFTGERVTGAGGWAHRVWSSGMVWVFICKEIKCYRVSYTYGGGEKD